jgi:hypothetical protein
MTERLVSVEINTKEAEKKLHVIRSYHMEIIVIVLSICVSYLFFANVKLWSSMNDYLMNNQTNTVQKMTENTDVLKEIKIILVENQVYLKAASK